MRVVKATSLETVVSTTHKLKKPIGLTHFKKVARPEWHSDSHSAPVYTLCLPRTLRSRRLGLKHPCLPKMQSCNSVIPAALCNYGWLCQCGSSGCEYLR